MAHKRLTVEARAEIVKNMALLPSQVPHGALAYSPIRFGK